VIATLKKWRANEWTPDQIAKITGMHADHVRRLTRPDRRPRFVYRHTDAAVREVDAIGIYTAFRVRDREAKAQERIAVLRLLINGMSQKGVAEQMGISPRIISRYVSEARLINLSRRAWWHRLHELETAINRYLSGKCTAYEAVSSVGMMATRFWGVSKVDRRVLTRKAVA
jgi:DNA-binding CsgD family transcriptional regulator